MDDRVVRCFAGPLTDLGAHDPSLHGILAAGTYEPAPTRGVTAQFLEHAADYAARYGNVAHFRVMLDDALARLDPPVAPRLVLDIGSGSGNSVLPLLDRFPDAFVVATDISPQLLAILRDHLAAEPRYAGRYALVCVDACEARFRDGVFDLAVGAAILHHVLEPDRVVDACARALVPGGAAIFFEPFELGHAVLHLAYADILREAERRGESTRGLAMVRRLRDDHSTRLTDPGDPRFLELDDKWMFTAGFFDAAARRGGWAECIVHATHASDAPLREMTRVNLRLGMGVDESALPQWAWDRLASYERAFSAQARAALMFEGAIVLRTSPVPRASPELRAGWWYEPHAPGRGFFIELANGRARVVCCHYEPEGAAVWHVAGPASLVEGAMQAPARRMALDEVRAAGPSDDGVLSLRFVSPAQAVIEWAGTTIELAPQHADSPGWRSDGDPAIGGYWIADADHPGVAAAIEALGSRIFVAALLPDGWCMSVATRRSAETFAGEWLEFRGGQALGAAYRAPQAPLARGDARFMRVETGRLVVQLPGGAHALLRRAAG